MVLLEAMANGVPIISTTVGAIPEVVADGVEGILITPGDIEALTEAISKLALDEALRLRHAKAARDRWADNYSTSVYASGVTTIWREAVGGPLPAVAVAVERPPDEPARA